MMELTGRLVEHWEVVDTLVGLQTAALGFGGTPGYGGGPGYPKCEGYDGTSWSTRPSMGSAQNTL